jgi:hypothetical protein
LPYKKNPNVRIPSRTKGRHTLFIDESGTASLKDQERFFILTAVISTNYSFEDIETFYENLKRKYFGYIQHIHSVELFSKKSDYVKGGKARLFKIIKYRKRYIQELSYFLDSIPFVYQTVIVDKKKMLEDINSIRINHPWSTTIGKAKEIFAESGQDIELFQESKISEILPIIESYEILPIDYFRPLEVAYREILTQHFQSYYRKIYSLGNRMHICMESSQYQSRVQKLTEDFQQETNKQQPKPKRTQFAKDLTNSLYCLSFPNKKAKYLGLEIADIISYGYYLSCHHRRQKNTLYADIWKVIQKRRREIEKKFGNTCVIRK